jgi:lipopolysaccharide transport system ATP-binding protein
MLSSNKLKALTVSNLSKKYTIATQSHTHQTLAEAALFRLKNPLYKPPTEEFWALQDVSFSVNQGDVLGVVGRNGAGKSTLLKLLSRITEPTSGEIALYGRVGSLLEVGTGFHPELTGRENIFLNGGILGMRRTEIARQFDEIVAFAEIEKHLDTPVKRYSSGMYVRLAFAVAAHLNPEILIVDEVLAVGDANFQRKCLGKMQEVAQGGGRTVLFVSHNMAAVRALCNRAILLKNGKLVLDDTTENVVKAYVQDSGASEANVVWEADNSATSCQKMRFLRAWVEDSAEENNSNPATLLDCTKPFTVCVEYEVLENITPLRILGLIQNLEGIPLCTTYDPLWPDRPGKVGRYVARCTFPGYFLNEGRYLVRFEADSPGDIVLLRTPADLGLSFEDINGHGLNAEKLPGVVRPYFDWQVSVL